MGSRERWGAVTKMTRTGTNVRIVLSVSRALVTEDDRWLYTDATDALGFVTYCYIEKGLDHCHIDILEESTETMNIVMG